MASKYFFKGLFGRDKNKGAEDQSPTADGDRASWTENKNADIDEGERDKLDRDPTALSDAERGVAPPTASPAEDSEAGAAEFLHQQEWFGAKGAALTDTPEATPEPAPTPSKSAKKEKKRGWLSRLTDGLSKSSNRLSEGVSSIFTKRKLDDATLEELEDLLISADLGVAAASRVTTALARDKFDKEVTGDDVRRALANEIAASLAPREALLAADPANRPHVILMIGVNGAGKTTTIGKLAKKFADNGKSVVLAAGDTFRAAAIEQLAVWGERAGAEVIAREVGADAAGLAFDAVKLARETNADVLLIDTAGRLQNKTALMDELAKIVRVLKKLDETAPHDVVLVLDATVGQNAVSQAKAFSEIAGVTGLIMTKLDGTARGGVLVSVADQFSLPIHYVGVGEGVDDLQPFRAASFSQALAGVEAKTEPADA